jgi:hypothetical protein
VAKGSTNDTLDLGSWCILRMASADTLKVARALDAAGLSVWTPTERKFGRKPRTRARYEREAAIMPTYAFGHVRCLGSLLRLTALPTSDYPKFQVFRFNGGIPLVSDEALEPLRQLEQHNASLFARWVRKGMKAPTFAPGSQVRMTEGAFGGLSGIVEGAQGQYTLVSIPGFHKPIKVASILLDRDAISMAEAA